MATRTDRPAHREDTPTIGIVLAHPAAGAAQGAEKYLRWVLTRRGNADSDAQRIRAGLGDTRA
ncbi:hypothetical protein [Qaidamihabitans albus]|uniref:hypothetical protein n=1 Tax=Qaidamihabitans albus TaxID=2795733 RepID=UPI0018F1E3F4|nr:hypothetical protein [Qaidamihabitans albus]